MEKYYFKVATAITEISPRAISHWALKLYMLHCRSSNRNKHCGCSLTGFTNAKKYFDFPDKAYYDKVMKELIDKHFVRYSLDVKTGYYQSKPVEILEFPAYDAKRKQFKPGINKRGHDHRVFDVPGAYLNIPVEVIDGGKLYDLDTETILALMKLYSITEEHFHGVDPRKVMGVAGDKDGCEIKSYTTFTENTELSIASRGSYFYRISEPGLNVEKLNRLIKKGLIQIKTVLAYFDPDDPDYVRIDKVLESDQFDRYIFETPVSEGYKVIHIYAPKYIVDGSYKKLKDETVKIPEQADKPTKEPEKHQGETDSQPEKTPFEHIAEIRKSIKENAGKGP